MSNDTEWLRIYNGDGPHARHMGTGNLSVVEGGRENRIGSFYGIGAAIDALEANGWTPDGDWVRSAIDVVPVRRK